MREQWHIVTKICGWSGIRMGARRLRPVCWVPRMQEYAVWCLAPQFCA